MLEMAVFEEVVDTNDRVVNCDTKESFTVNTKSTSGVRMLRVLRECVKSD